MAEQHLVLKIKQIDQTQKPLVVLLKGEHCAVRSTECCIYSATSRSFLQVPQTTVL